MYEPLIETLKTVNYVGWTPVSLFFFFFNLCKQNLTIMMDWGPQYIMTGARWEVVQGGRRAGMDDSLRIGFHSIYVKVGLGKSKPP